MSSWKMRLFLETFCMSLYSSIIAHVNYSSVQSLGVDRDVPALAPLTHE